MAMSPIQSELPKTKRLGEAIGYFVTPEPVSLHHSYSPFDRVIQPNITAFRICGIVRMHCLLHKGDPSHHNFSAYAQTGRQTRVRSQPIPHAAVFGDAQHGLYKLGSWIRTTHVRLESVFLYEKVIVAFGIRPSARQHILVYTLSKKSWYQCEFSTVQQEMRYYREMRRGMLTFADFKRIQTHR